jgi:hypothetical protein
MCVILYFYTAFIVYLPNFLLGYFPLNSSTASYKDGNKKCKLIISVYNLLAHFCSKFAPKQN